MRVTLLRPVYKTPSALRGGSLAAYERRGRMVRVAPGVYEVGGRRYHVRSVQTVKAPVGDPTFLQWAPTFTAEQPLLLDLRSTARLARMGCSVATDGCHLSRPGDYCKHGFPSNALLWGLA